ncbi:putative signal transduction GGDEF domain-containing protein [Gottschalkia acidurici 9a]|uniref:Signal transduction GGDEF domain-containing protein n=1 Tax=Gottschalkia acidurici (strain ATCC 7906 / DSM 604 / BCRC 14475 / CIP 104303 / KCTC 5404 / NCIMB 10678 / 9a) TaxID=1128398 RepID=K0B326_GOTA9|nr:response regulator [Gottschalkia acidurici]AFS79859.1 putative signal transduction GGDEF domain-containing protein [Gottschalkia acidurici 9a]
MYKDLDINKLSYESKEIFLGEQGIKAINIINTLIEFRLNPKSEYKEDIKRFFSSICAASSILGYNNLLNAGEYYASYIDSVDEVTVNSHEFFSNLLNGIGIIRKEIEMLKVNLNNEKLNTNKDIISSISSVKKRRSKGNILILDDDRLTLSILKDAFKEEGYNVKTTTNPYDAIEQALSSHINIVLIDIIMPKLNGFEVFEILKKNKIDIPIIFLTGKSLTDYKVDALSKGADDYITKPFEIKEVIARVERALMRSRQYKSKLNIDKLTGVHTKDFFNEKIKQITKCTELSQDLSVAFIDIDDFKLINDTYGHLVGDYILRDFAEFLEEHIDQKDLIFRFGGDEFIVLFNGKKEIDAFECMEVFREKLNDRIFIYDDLNCEINITISIGVTSINNRDSIEKILKRSDKCLYKSKELGKNRTICCNNIKTNRDYKNKIVMLKEESNITDFIKTKFKYIGYEFYSTYDENHLEELIKQFTPNLVILDLTMEYIDPINICKKIRNYDNVKKTKIIVIVDKNQKREITECVQIGVDEYIIKPFSVLELERRVSLLLNNNKK